MNEEAAAYKLPLVWQKLPSRKDWWKRRLQEHLPSRLAQLKVSRLILSSRLLKCHDESGSYVRSFG